MTDENKKNFKKVHLLIYDEKSFTSSLAAEAYKANNFICKIVSDYDRFLEAKVTKKYQAIILNFDFLRDKVFQICHEIRETQNDKKTPIVVTGITLRIELSEKLTTAGASLLIEQPIPKEYILEKIKSILAIPTRKHKRISADMLGPVNVHQKSYNISAQIENISVSGILIRTKRDLEKKINIELLFHLPDDPIPVCTTAKIVRYIEDKKLKKDDFFLIGLEFENFSKDGKERLSSFIQTQLVQDDPFLLY